MCDIPHGQRDPARVLILLPADVVQIQTTEPLTRYMYLFVVIVVHGALFSTAVRTVFVIVIAAVVHDVSACPRFDALAADVAAAVSAAACVAAADVAVTVLAAAAAVGQIVDLVVGPHLQHYGVMW